MPSDSARDVNAETDARGEYSHLTIAASNAGAMLQAVGFTQYIQNGTLKLDGVLENSQQRMTGRSS